MSYDNNTIVRCYAENSAELSIYDAVTLVGPRTVGPAADGDAVFGVLAQNPHGRGDASPLNRVVVSGVCRAHVADAVDTESDAPARLVAGTSGTFRLLGDGETVPDGSVTVRAFERGPRGEEVVVLV